MLTIEMMNVFRKLINIKKAFCFSIIILLTTSVILTQEALNKVEGIVLSTSGTTFPDVTINFEGSEGLPVVTDGSGKFVLEVPSGDVWLLISPPRGYKDKRVFLNSREFITIFVTPNEISSGYDKVNLISQSINKRDIVATYSELDPTDIKYTHSISIDEFMTGRVPGLHVVNRSGEPASGAVTMIRGMNSILSNNQPLYIVDGIPLLSHEIFASNLNGYSYNPLLSLNPFDITNITVIKDPVISATYGSKGSNGIIFIETLEPAATQTTIDIDIRGGYALSPGRLIPQLNAIQHKTLVNSVLSSSPLLEEQMLELYPNLFLKNDDSRFIDYQHNTNWQDYIFNNSSFSNINFAVEGGDEIARYGLSLGYTSSDGIIKSTGFEGYNLRFVSRTDIFRWLRMNAGVALNYNTSVLKETASVNGTSPIIASLAKSPLSGPYQYDLEGRRLIRLSESDEFGISNPLAIINNFFAGNVNYNFTSSLNLGADISDNLSMNSLFSLSYNVLKETVFMPNLGMARYHDLEAHNISSSTNNTISTFYNNTYLIYQKTIGDHHNLSLNTGMNISTNRFEMDYGLTRNAHENDRYRSLQHGQNNLREVGGQNRNWNWISVYEYLNYSYKDKYLLSASISLDGSTRIGQNADNTFSIGGQPFGLSYAGGIAWRISNEPFLKNIPWLEELKLRASIGQSLNDNIGEASAERYFEAILYRETAGLHFPVMFNDRLTYETVSQINMGLDLSLMGNRLAAKIDYFRSFVDNMLVYRTLPPYLGYDGRLENAGAMVNEGLEFGTFVRLIDGYNFKWDIQTSISSINNEVKSIDGGKNVIDLNYAQIVNQPGSPANSFYGYIYEGVYKSQEEATETGLVNERGIPYSAGDALYSDISGPGGEADGIINEYDKTVIGSMLPKHFGGISNAFNYRRWLLSFFVQFVSGNDVFNYVRYRNERMTGLENQSTSTLNRWQYDGHETSIPRALWNDPIGNADFSTRWIEDGSYLRISNITLGYKIPTQFFAFRNAEFYISVNNLFVFSNYLGYDPEFANSFSNPGIDYGQPPHSRQFVGGIRFGL
jgi:TonB-linked SusC/RagA family outer membrane protein